jgi:pilus assembly protein FimV
MAIDKNKTIKEAQKYVAKGQLDKAIAEWKKLLKETPDDPNIYNTIGDLCLKKNSKTEAVEAYYKAASLLAADGFTSKAIALYKKFLNIDPKKMDAHLALGDLNAEKGLTGNALESYKIVADHYIQQHQTAKALDIYQKMADLSPSNIAFHIKLGDMYAKEGMKEKSAKAYLAAADAHLSKSSFKDARHLFEKVLALDPGNKEVYHKAGIVYFKEGKFVEACKALKPAFESDPSNKGILDIYIEALDKAGKDIEAEQVIRKLLAENPDNADLRQKLYNLYLTTKNFEKALVEAETLAEGKINSGNIGAAEDLYKAFVAGSPYFPPIRQKLAEFYISAKRPMDAAAELVQAAELFVTEGDFQSAKAVLTQAIEIAPEMSAASERLEQLQTPVTGAPPSEPEFTTAEGPIPTAPSTVVSEAESLSVLETPPPAPAPVSPAAEAAPVLAEEDPAIIEAFTEADVLIKYGLADKAIEQLEALSSNFLENPRIRIKLRDIYHEQGNTDKAVQHALFAVELYTKYGSEEQATASLQEILEMAPEHPEVLSRIGRVPVALEEPVREALEEIPQREETLAETAPPQEPAHPAEIESEGFGKEPVAPEPEEPMGEADEEIQQQELIPDHLESSLTEPETSPTAPEETLAETVPPREPDHPGEIESEGLGKEPVAPEPEEPMGEADEEIQQQELIPDHLESSLTEPETSPTAPEETLAETAPSQEPAQTGEIEFEGLDSEIPLLEETAPFATTPVGESPGIEQPPVEKTPLFDEAPSLAEPTAEEQPSLEKESADEEVPPVIAPPEETAAHEPPAEVDINGIWAEAEFYFQQGLFEEARKHYKQIMVLTPGNQRAIDRLAEISREEDETREFSKLSDAVEGLEGYLRPEATEGALAASTSDDEAVRALMLEIQQLKQQLTPPTPPMKERQIVAPPPVKAAEAVSGPIEPEEKTDEEDFFDLGAELRREAASAQQGEKSSGDFFDLAAELRDELTDILTPVQPAVPVEEQSLDDIFEEFKKGIEQQSAKEDVDTHYNLGVAYKEMGLLDDAIGAFSMTTEDEPKFVQSRYMLGLCYMEKGEYQDAINEIRNALDYAESLGYEAENPIEMHYDLGLACQCAGDISSAVNEFQKVVDANPGFRDTAARLKELQKGDYISLEQLKNDIEKEISSKFLEEGVRIEREEKTRKNERVGK